METVKDMGEVFGVITEVSGDIGDGEPVAAVPLCIFEDFFVKGVAVAAGGLVIRTYLAVDFQQKPCGGQRDDVVVPAVLCQVIELGKQDGEPVEKGQFSGVGERDDPLAVFRRTVMKMKPVEAALGRLPAKLAACGGEDAVLSLLYCKMFAAICYIKRSLGDHHQLIFLERSGHMPPGRRGCDKMTGHMVFDKRI